MAENNKNEMYEIPVKFRLMENMHIVFWLFKDLAWCMEWKILGTLMIVPTIAIAAKITYNTKNIASEFWHNFAVLFWIAANGYWMLTEFTGIDEKKVFGTVDYKHLAVIPFAIGIVILSYYYLVVKPKEKNSTAAL